jgi:hypothetical protein
MTSATAGRQVEVENGVLRAETEVPVGVAAQEKGWSRERMTRAIQSGLVAGRFRFGRWWVDRNALAQLLAQPD